jgi:hypothetical protein
MSLGVARSDEQLDLSHFLGTHAIRPESAYVANDASVEPRQRQRTHPRFVKQVLIEREGDGIREIPGLLVGPRCVAIDPPQKVIVSGAVGLDRERQEFKPDRVRREDLIRINQLSAKLRDVLNRSGPPQLHAEDRKSGAGEGLHQPLAHAPLPNNLGEFAPNAGLSYDRIEPLGYEYSVDKCFGILRRIFDQSALVVGWQAIAMLHAELVKRPGRPTQAMWTHRLDEPAVRPVNVLDEQYAAKLGERPRGTLFEVTS